MFRQKVSHFSIFHPLYNMRWLVLQVFCCGTHIKSQSTYLPHNIRIANYISPHSNQFADTITGHPSRTLRILSPNLVAYLDHTGSGCETVSHMYEPSNHRLTVMLSSFGPSPRIMRLFCTGTV